jgi:DNA-binding LytR/AlgR family response regulator
MTVIRYDPIPHLTVIDIDQCDFIENEGRRVVYYIGDEKYYHIGTKSEMEMLLEKEGFEVLDRPYLVNMKRIDRYDEKDNKVYFSSNKNDNKYVTVARGSTRLVREYMSKKNGMAKGEES